MQSTNSPSETEAAWEQIEPLLDDAMAQLGESDRAAILLRFFQRKRLREVGSVLGLDEDAARKRVDRALAKLRDWFASRGVVYPAALVGAALSAHSAQAVPAALAANVSAAALKAGATSFGAFNLIKLLATMKLKTSLPAAGILLVIALIVVNRQKQPDRAGAPDTASRVATSTQKPEPQTDSAFWRRVRAAQEARRASATADASLRDALARLREALYGPPTPGSFSQDPAFGILQSIPLEQRVVALDMVMEALRDPTKHVCLRAIQLIPSIWPKGEAALPTLFDLIRTKSAEWPEVAQRALMAAVQVRSETDIVPELVTAAMQGPSSAKNALTAQVLLLKSQIKDSSPFFAASLQPYLNSLAADERLAAAQALAQLPGPKNPAVLAELIASLEGADGTHTDKARVRRSLEALWKVGAEARDAIPALQTLGQQNSDFRDFVNIVLKALAPDALKGVGAPTPLPPLDSVAAAVAGQIENGTISVAGLANALDNPATSLIAARALAEFGPAANEALPALERAFESASRTNITAALVLGAVMERLNPDAPKSLLLMTDLMPALEAVHAEAQRAGQPAWNDALERLPQRVPISMAVRHVDVRLLAAELGRIDPQLRDAFVGKLLDSDRKLGAIFQTAQ